MDELTALNLDRYVVYCRNPGFFVIAEVSTKFPGGDYGCVVRHIHS